MCVCLLIFAVQAEVNTAKVQSLHTHTPMHLLLQQNYSTNKRVATTRLCCSFCCRLCCNSKQTKASNQNETKTQRSQDRGRERERRSKMPKPTKRIYNTKLKSPPPTRCAVLRCCCAASTTPLPLPPSLPSSTLSHFTTTISRP